MKSDSRKPHIFVPFAYFAQHVKPENEKNPRDSHGKRWWQHSEAATGMRRVISGLDRYIATLRVSKHRIFVLLDARVLPDDGVTIIPKSDDTTFGIIRSRLHELWASLLLNGRVAGGDPHYAATTALATFPFPKG